MDEILDYDEELGEVEAKIVEGIEMAKKASLFNKSHHIAQLLGYMRRAQTLMQSYDLELKELHAESSDIILFGRKRNTHFNMLGQYERQILHLRDEMKSRRAAFIPNEPVTPNTILGEAANKQLESLDAMNRINRQIVATEDVGIVINTNLVEDRERLQQVNNDMNVIDSDLVRARGELMSFIRRWQRDKCIRAMLILILLGVLVVIVWSIVDPDFDITNSNTTRGDHLN